MQFQQLLDLDGFEAGEVAIDAHGDEIGDLGRQHHVVPAGIERELVVGQHIGPLLRLAQAAKLDHRNLVRLQLAGGKDAAVAGDDAVVAVDQDRVGPAELADRGGDLRHLGIGMGAGVAGIGDQIDERAVFHGKALRIIATKLGRPQSCPRVCRLDRGTWGHAVRA